MPFFLKPILHFFNVPISAKNGTSFKVLFNFFPAESLSLESSDHPLRMIQQIAKKEVLFVLFIYCS